MDIRKTVEKDVYACSPKYDMVGATSLTFVSMKAGNTASHYKFGTKIIVSDLVKCDQKGGFFWRGIRSSGGS